MAVALDLVAQRPDHLRMTEIAALAHVDRATGELERRVGTHALDLLDRAFEVEQRSDLDDAPDRDDQQDADDEKDRVLLDHLVAREDRHDPPPTRPAAGPGARPPRRPRPTGWSSTRSTP